MAGFPTDPELEMKISIWKSKQAAMGIVENMEGIEEYDFRKASTDLKGRWFLMCSYLYYICQVDSPLTDPQFDKLCREILEDYDNLADDRKRVIDKGMLKAGTAFNLKHDDYALITRNSAWGLHEKHRAGRVRIIYDVY